MWFLWHHTQQILTLEDRSILKTEPESEVEPGSDKWQYVERPVPEVCVCVCVCCVRSLTVLEKILLYLIGQHWSCDSHSLPL